MWDEIRRLRAEGMTVFITTHYLDEADALCDRIAIMDYGQVVAEGTPDELKREIAGDVVTVGFGDRPEVTPHAAQALDSDSPDKTQHCAMAKRLATDAGFAVCNEALQLHGGYGYIREYPIERIFRDLRVHQILEGTNEIMRVIIARKLLSQ